MKDVFIKSLLNYTGGKYELLPQILPLLPQNINTFYDIFGGGFNVGINIKCEKVVYNDLLKPLVDMMSYLKSQTLNEIQDYIETTIKEYELTKSNKDGFISFRNTYNKTKNPIDLYILSCYSFNCMIRYNSKMEFNMPFGNRSFSDSMKNNLIQFRNKLDNIDVSFTSFNFKDINIDNINNEDFIYCDPPYLISNASYNEKRGFDGWNTSTETDLYIWLDKLNDKDVKFALSNVIHHKGLTNDILIEWSKKYHTTYLNKHYATCNYHQKNRNKDETTEVLITNYIPEVKEEKTLFDEMFGI